MPYQIAYQLETYSDLEMTSLRNKDDVIEHLLWLLAQHEPVIAQVKYPDGYITSYNQAGGVV